ncbi:unnamed protein product [Ectocarpus sp. 13 AM-2016]
MVLKRTLSIAKAPDLDEEEEEEELERFKASPEVVREVFSHLDRHEVGYVNREQVQTGLQTLELPSKADHVEGLFTVFDKNRDGVIHFAEFEELALHRRHAAHLPRTDGKHAFSILLADVFENLDHTADGFIRKEDIRRALDKLDIVASDAQIT